MKVPSRPTRSDERPGLNPLAFLSLPPRSSRPEPPLTHISPDEGSSMSEDDDLQDNSSNSPDPILSDWFLNSHRPSLYLAEKTCEMVCYWFSSNPPHLNATISVRIQILSPHLSNPPSLHTPVPSNTLSTSRSASAYMTPTRPNHTIPTSPPPIPSYLLRRPPFKVICDDTYSNWRAQRTQGIQDYCSDATLSNLSPVSSPRKLPLYPCISP